MGLVTRRSIRKITSFSRWSYVDGRGAHVVHEWTIPILRFLGHHSAKVGSMVRGMQACYENIIYCGLHGMLSRRCTYRLEWETWYSAYLGHVVRRRVHETGSSVVECSVVSLFTRRKTHHHRDRIRANHYLGDIHRRKHPWSYGTHLIPNSGSVLSTIGQCVPILFIEHIRCRI